MMMKDATRRVGGGAQRAIHLVLAAVVAFAFVGYFVGTRHVHTPRLAVDPRDIVETEHDYEGPVVPAMRYVEVARGRFSPNRHWQSMLSDLDQPEFDLFAEVHHDERARAELLALRASRRAYPGAPPVVPHTIDQMTSMSCMACHGEGLRLPGGRIASKMPHEFLPNCTQCHVEMRSFDLEPFVLAENTFEPIEWPEHGTRAWDGAPPTIPHPTFMRNDCMACHGSIAHEPLRTSHPWQTNCMQCHAPSAALDQVVPRDTALTPHRRILIDDPG